MPLETPSLVSAKTPVIIDGMFFWSIRRNIFRSRTLMASYFRI